MTRRSDLEPEQDGAYDSTLDLPSMRKMLADLESMKTLTRFIARSQRSTVLELERQIRRLGTTVDAFYATLGDRHWIYHDDLEVSLVERLIAMEPSVAERALIDSYKDPETLAIKVRRLRRFPELVDRMNLIEHAQSDFQAGRYYATVQVLLSVMDGFVNDIEPDRRRGLHARQADQLLAWDSVVGHHLGLTHAHETFTRTFKKRSTGEVTELYRNGIVHGMLTGYDNDIVAAKAWNRLFAVADWATSKVKQQAPPKAKPSWREILRSIVRNAATRRALEQWAPSVLSHSDQGFETDDVVVATRRYLDAWQARNYGAMAELLSPLVSEETLGKTAGLVREAFEELTLAGYELNQVEHSAAAVANVEADLQVSGNPSPSRLRWIRSGPDGMSVSPIQPGSWRLMTWTQSGMQSERSSR